MRNTSQASLDNLLTPSAEAGFDLAIRLARLGVKAMQPDPQVRTQLRPDYSTDAAALIAASQVIAVHFSTIAAANSYWHPTTGNKHEV